MEVFDVIIVGGGPIGLTLGIEAKKNNLSYLILEKGVLVNSLYNFPTGMTFFSTSRLLEIGDVPFISHQDKPTRSEALEYFRRVYNRWDLNAHFYERVEEISNDDMVFKVVSDSKCYLSKNVVIATGFYDHPNLMNIPGEELKKVSHFYDDPHPYINQKVAIIGAANSACDVALELFQKGASVSMIVRKSEINDRVKYWIKPNIQNRIKEGSITAYFDSTPLEIKEKSLCFMSPDGPKEIDNDFVLAMTGYQPDYAFLDKLGISYSDQDLRIPTYNPGSHESNITGMYLAEVVCGGLKTNTFFIENAKDHAEKIIKAIRSN